MVYFQVDAFLDGTGLAEEILQVNNVRKNNVNKMYCSRIKSLEGNERA